MLKSVPECFEDVKRKLQDTPKQQRTLIPSVMKICKLLDVNPATSAISERTFSSGRNINTWQRSTTKAERFNALSILYIYKNITDEIDLVGIGNDFVAKHSERKNIFGVFSEKDLK